MYFQDNSKYTYSLPSRELENVRNIGWLSKEYSFNTGASSLEFKKKLLNIIFLKDCNRMRGIHICDICLSSHNLCVHSLGHIYQSKGLPNVKKNIKLLGHSEIWIPSIEGDLIYASPTLIYHYILDHYYLPSQDYIESVLAFDLNADWDGDKILENLNFIKRNIASIN